MLIEYPTISVITSTTFSPKKSIISRYGTNTNRYKEMLRKQQRELRKEKLNNLNNIFLSEE